MSCSTLCACTWAPTTMLSVRGGLGQQTSPGLGYRVLGTSSALITSPEGARLFGQLLQA